MLKYVKILWSISNMEDDSKKLYLELQMEELKAALGVQEEASVAEMNKAKIEQLKEAAAKKNRDKNADVAKLYENAAEYEKELEHFEKELEIINSHQVKDIVEVLCKKLPDEERNYGDELKAIIVAGWVHSFEGDELELLGQCELIKKVEFSNIVDALVLACPESSIDFDVKVKAILTKRLETLIGIKKDHIEEEIEEIYIAGLKPSFVKRIYKEYHGLA
jgi:tetratricopeptide (TPR) repeat protein